MDDVLLKVNTGLGFLSMLVGVVFYTEYHMHIHSSVVFGVGGFFFRSILIELFKMLSNLDGR